MTDLIMAALCGALISGAGSWLAVSSTFSTRAELAAGLKALKDDIDGQFKGLMKQQHETARSLSERIDLNTRSFGDLRAKAEHIHSRHQISSILKEEAPWNHDKAGILRDLKSHERRLEVQEQTSTQILQTLARIEEAIRKNGKPS